MWKINGIRFYWIKFFHWQIYRKLEARDVLPNINRKQPPNGRTNGVFCPWWLWPLTLIFKLVRATDQTRLPCKFGANPFSGSRDISYTNKLTAQKQNLPLFTAFGKCCLYPSPKNSPHLKRVTSLCCEIWMLKSTAWTFSYSVTINVLCEI